MTPLKDQTSDNVNETPIIINCVGVILAGGRSTRMGGGDKFLRPLAGTTMLDLVLNSLKAQLETNIISTNGDPARLSAYNLPAITDEIDGYAGPLAGMHAALSWTAQNQPNATHCLSVAADTPFFPENYAARMTEHAVKIGSKHIIIATSNGRHQPGFALWPLTVKDKLERALKDGTRKVRAFTDNQPNSTLAFEQLTLKGIEIDPFFNVNEPADLALCQKLLLSNS